MYFWFGGEGNRGFMLGVGTLPLVSSFIRIQYLWEVGVLMVVDD